MKKQTLFLALLFAASTAFAQIEVLPNGNVGIGTPPNFSFNEHWRTHVNAPDKAIGLNVQRTGGRPVFPSGQMSIINAVRAHSFLTVNSAVNIGVTGSASSTTNSGVAIGVHGIVDGGASGRNFGVFGERTMAAGFGAGIVGTSAANMGFTSTPFVPGFYAAFFAGDVRTTGTVHGTLLSGSDSRFKQNIVSLGDAENAEGIISFSHRGGASVLDNLMLLNPVQYNLQQVFFDPDESRSLEERAFFDEESQLFQKPHFGFIAQELREVFPNLVFEDEIGWLAINYTGMIPLLLQGMKDLKAIIEVQNARIEQLERGLIGIPAPPPIQTMSVPAPTPSSEWNLFDETGRTAALYQNAPNPFRQATEIRFYLPQTVAAAFLIFYDLQGRQLHQITLNQRGEGVEIIQGSQFVPGIYLYALIADGQAIAVKQMIITE